MKWSWRRILGKKGVSPVIGMVLITAVLLTIVALFVVWRSTQEDLQLQRERERIQQLKMVEGESVAFITIPGGSLGNKNITFYNNGTVRPTIRHVYVDGIEIPNSNYTITWGTDPRTGYVNFAAGVSASITDSLKLETELGNLYTFALPSAVIDILSWNDTGDKVLLLLDASKSTAGGVVNNWEWYVCDAGGAGSATLKGRGARVSLEFDKEDENGLKSIFLVVADSTDEKKGATKPFTQYPSSIYYWDRPGVSQMEVNIPGPGEEGEGGEGEPGFGGEGAPGGIYISLSGTGGGTSVAEGRIISFNIKNFSGRMIPLTGMRFYGVKSPSNYTVNHVEMGPVGGTMGVYYDGTAFNDGAIAQFNKAYYVGDKDEVHVEVKASTGGLPGDGDVFLVVLYDAATPQNYYTVTVPIRTEDSTDVVVFDCAAVFHVTGNGYVLQGKSLDLNNKVLKSIGVAFSSPPDDTDPCEDRMIEFNVAGTVLWSGSVGSESSIFLGNDTNGDGIPDAGVTWDNSRTVQFTFNFSDVVQRFYYFVYRFADGSSVAHKVPRFSVSRASGQPDHRDVSSSTGGTVTWTFEIGQIDQLTTPMDLAMTGLPCFCTATFNPASPVGMPQTVIVTIQVLPGAPTGLYPLVFTGSNNLNAYSTVVFLHLT